ncbi:MAG: hypothetical protein NZM40_02190 [Sphingomonadaceae bacterium]|uniref:hypothetical protein n=1 Tax=Thermaurantiacus sp. TaxID=2820283 RepID=UPI00298EE99E|nr:hypothetical protein [Thermaurantiacus sp.]MCS6986239.1 hypothetical protein [Sphingomonadaceae bacterium]MDW8415686.1 hypothetical protein [Thermaurantiacus sp.]
MLVTTRTGRDSPGGGAALSFGRFGEVGGEAEWGVRDGAWSADAAVEADREDGWRRFSPSRRTSACSTSAATPTGLAFTPRP